jgi:alkanesulfonate monooxygenase
MDLEIFSTCPQVAFVPREEYLKQVIAVARWSEENGCRGILVYTDNSQADPWLISQVIIQNTETLSPLVAIQPAYMHPYAVAKMVSTMGHLYNRRIYLNMVAGGFKNDLASLDDVTPHDKRYDRLVEYTKVINGILGAREPFTFCGEFYKIDKPGLTPPLPRELMPGMFMSGSSEAGLAAARATGATAIKYPKPAAEYQGRPPEARSNSGVRVGIVTRENEEEAWGVAFERFPEDRRGQIAHQLAMKTSDSAWHRQLSEMTKQPALGRNPYWLHPFETYKTFCPYLVGSYEGVAKEIARYTSIGYRTFILDIPPSGEELRHAGIAFDRASKIFALNE